MTVTACSRSILGASQPCLLPLLAAGVLTGQFLAIWLGFRLPAGMLLAVLLVAAFAGGLGRVSCQKTVTLGWLLLTSVCCSAWLTVSALDDYRALQPAADVDGKVFVLDGTIVGLPEALRAPADGDYPTWQPAVGWRFDFELKDGQALAGRLRVSWYRSKVSPVPGEHWRLPLKIRLPRGFQNPGGFNYAEWLMTESVVATAVVNTNVLDASKTNLIQKIRSAEQRRWKPFHTVSDWLGSWRYSVNAWLLDASDGLSHPGILLALGVGNRQKIEPEAWQRLQRTGTAHLVAISGLHVGLIAGLFGWLAAGLWRLIGSRRGNGQPAMLIAVAVGGLTALLYAALAGFSLPTQRALWMLLAVALLLLRRRASGWWTMLSLAMIAVLLADPLAVLSAGFWLSFSAVMALWWLVGMRLRRPAWWSGWLWLQIGLLCLLLPIMVFSFNRVSWIAPLANAIVVPVFTVVEIPLVLAAAVIGSIHDGLGNLLLLLADWVLMVCWACLGWLDSLPNAATAIPAANHPVLLLLALIGCCWLVAPRGVPGRLISPLLVLPLLLGKPASLMQWEFSAIALDVGQGLAVVVRTANHNLVYDTGPAFRSGTDTGGLVIAPYLRSQGINRIDRLVISHGDNDHAGGAATLVSQFEVGDLIASEPFTDTALESCRKPCQHGQQWRSDGVLFEILHPGTDGASSGNDGSCVLKISSEAGSLLLTGDIERSAERQLLAQTSVSLQAEVLFAPHHGSRTSSTPEFIRAVSPAHVIFPAGYRNRWGFPVQEIIDRYAAFGIQRWTTGEQGAVMMRFGLNEPIEFKVATCQRRYRWWEANLCQKTLDPDLSRSGS